MAIICFLFKAVKRSSEEGRVRSIKAVGSGCPAKHVTRDMRGTYLASLISLDLQTIAYDSSPFRFCGIISLYLI